MAGRGPAPKPVEKRQRRNADPVPSVVLDADARVSRPPALPGAADLSPATRRWYRTWATSAQATLFTGTDWQRLHMLAPLVERYFEKHDAKVLAEIRLNEEKLGATIVDRQRARVDIRRPELETAGAGKSSRSRPDPRRLHAVK